MERNTIQRMMIFEDVLSRNDHPTAIDVFESVKTKLPSISLTTVYRNLNSLADDNQILRISSSAGNSDRYDRTIVQHAHVMCERCGAFFDFFDAPSCDSSIQRLSDDYDFLVTRCGTIFVGVCAKCKNEQKNESSIL